MNNYHKTKKLWINQGTTHSIKNHIEWGYFNHFNYFWSCRLHVNIFDVKYLTQDSTDLSYFVKIIHIFTDSVRGSQTFACVYMYIHVYLYICVYTHTHKHTHRLS